MSLINEVRTGLLTLDQSKKSLRTFALIVGTFLIISSIITFFWGEAKSNSLWLTIIALLFLASGLAYPKILKFIHSIWMMLAFTMGFFVSRIILTLVFYLAITPIALIFRLLGKDVLDRKINSKTDTYWKKREKNRDGLEGLERQF